jgi:hypothetical protein
MYMTSRLRRARECLLRTASAELRQKATTGSLQITIISSKLGVHTANHINPHSKVNMCWFSTAKRPLHNAGDWEHPPRRLSNYSTRNPNGIRVAPFPGSRSSRSNQAIIHVGEPDNHHRHHSHSHSHSHSHHSMRERERPDRVIEYVTR